MCFETNGPIQGPWLERFLCPFFRNFEIKSSMIFLMKL